MTRIDNEQSVYEKTGYDQVSGEMDAWDRVIFPAVIRKRQIALLRRFSEAGGGIILDVGCGAGWTTHFFSQQGRKTVGVDVSKSLLAGAKKFHRNLEEYVLADGSRLPIKSGSIRMIMSASSLHHLPPEKTLGEWRRVLTPTGKLVLIEPNALNPLASIGRHLFPMETHTKDERPFVPMSLRKMLLETGWEISHWETQILFAFVVSRLLRLWGASNSFAQTLSLLVERLEELGARIPIANRFGWVVFCVAKRSL